MTRLFDTLRNERGGVLVIVAVFLTSGVMLLAFSIDVGHWFEHKRHLQLQVDNGAFAGATNFNGCISASTADRADKTKPANVAIQDMARKFAGDTVHVASALNPQVNNRANVTVVLNSTKYPSDGGTDYSDPNGPFCQSGYVDVKSTEVYIQIDLTMKREALALVGSPTRPAAKDGRLPNDLLVWLESL